MIKTNVTPQSKAKAIPHPNVGRGENPAQAYNDPSKKGKEISFIPAKKVDTMHYTARSVKKN